MAKIDLSKYGITGATDIVYNPSYELLFEEETKAGLEGYEVGKETELGSRHRSLRAFSRPTIRFSSPTAPVKTASRPLSSPALIP